MLFLCRKENTMYRWIDVKISKIVIYITEMYLFCLFLAKDSGQFDYPDEVYNELGVEGDSHVDMYDSNSHVWIPRCNDKKNRHECIKHATCGAKIPGYQRLTSLID